MRTGINLDVSAPDQARMEAIVADRGSPQNHVWRCRIVLLTAAGRGTNSIMREASVAKTAVWRWQERFMQEGIDGLLRDKTRPPGKPPLPRDIVNKVVAMTQTEPPGETTHWTAPAMAKVIGISVSSVQRIAERKPNRASPQVSLHDAMLELDAGSRRPAAGGSWQRHRGGSASLRLNASAAISRRQELGSSATPAE